MALHRAMAPRTERYRCLESVPPQLPGLRLWPWMQTPDLAWNPVVAVALGPEVVELSARCLHAMLAIDAACLRAHTRRQQKNKKTTQVLQYGVNWLNANSVPTKLKTNRPIKASNAQGPAACLLT